MSQEEQFASNGRLVAEYAEAKQRLIALRAETRRIAEAAEKLGKFIHSAHPRMYKNGMQYAKLIPPPDKITELLNQISSEAERVESLGAQLSALGVSPDHEFLAPFVKPNA